MSWIKLVDRKFIWGRSGGRCAFPDCGRELVEEVTESGKGVVLAQECHIVASSDAGPRADPTFPSADRDSYHNLMLLCLEHHKIVDDDPDTWNVDRLRRMKKD